MMKRFHFFSRDKAKLGYGCGAQRVLQNLYPKYAMILSSTIITDKWMAVFQIILFPMGLEAP